MTSLGSARKAYQSMPLMPTKQQGGARQQEERRLPEYSCTGQLFWAALTWNSVGGASMACFL